MFTAKEARERSNEQAIKIAKEFIWNTASKEIQKAIEKAYCNCNIDVSELDFPERIGPFIVEILTEEYGFSAKFVNDTEYPPEQYIFVDWSDIPKGDYFNR